LTTGQTDIFAPQLVPGKIRYVLVTELEPEARGALSVHNYKPNKNRDQFDALEQNPPEVLNSYQYRAMIRKVGLRAHLHDNFGFEITCEPTLWSNYQRFRICANKADIHELDWHDDARMEWTTNLRDSGSCQKQLIFYPGQNGKEDIAVTWRSSNPVKPGGFQVNLVRDKNFWENLMHPHVSVIEALPITVEQLMDKKAEDELKGLFSPSNQRIVGDTETREYIWTAMEGSRKLASYRCEIHDKLKKRDRVVVEMSALVTVDLGNYKFSHYQYSQIHYLTAAGGRTNKFSIKTLTDRTLQ